MRTLLYKRTHSGDPDTRGQFGINGCMGGVRSWEFDAVIGVGGQGAEAVAWGIARKLTWIGIGPHKSPVAGVRDPILTFDHFWYEGDRGPELSSIAPCLAELMYVKRARTVMTFTPQQQAEVNNLLARASSSPASTAVSLTKLVRVHRRCRSALS